MTDLDNVAVHLAEWHKQQARRHWLEAKWWADFGGVSNTVIDTLEIDIPEWINSQSKEMQ